MTDQSQQNENTWHYTKDTLTMLSVSVAQIQSILSDGGESVSELTESFIELAQTFKQLADHTTDIEKTDLNEIKHQIEQGIVAFQFYDRISQRLDHVSTSLMNMGNIIGDKEQRDKPEAWQQFQDDIQSKFTMESERALFEQILKGVPIEEALEAAKKSSKPESDDSIELF